jgi:hypothetical protein
MSAARLRWPVALLLLLSGAFSPSLIRGQREGASDSAAVVGKSASALGTLFVRSAKSKTWRAVRPGEAVQAGDDLVALPGNKGVVDLEGAGLRLELVGLLPEWHPPPTGEGRVRLFPLLASPTGKESQADFALERGRVILSNRRQAGAAEARIHVLKSVWALTLDEPKAAALLQRSNIWPPGVQYTKKASPQRQPFTHVFLLLRSGKGRLSVGTEQYSLRKLTFYQWTNAGGIQGPLPLKEVPPFLKPLKDRPAEANEARRGAEQLRKLLTEGSVADGLRKALRAKEAGTRRAAVAAAAGFDDAAALLDALADGRHAETRSAAVVSLRHWLGQKAEHAGELYQALVERGYKTAQAETVLHLLHSFSPLDRSRPETYDTLIAYLQHDKLPIRELAAWQLEHMVPQGRKIGYDAAAPVAQRARAIAAWRRLIPEGQLPPLEKKAGGS